VVVYPDNIIYSGVTVKDVPELVSSLQSGDVIERLVLSPEAPAEIARHDFYQAVVDPDPTRPADEFSTLAGKHGYDADWIAEQAKRGFIARKPSPDGGETITVTKKARTRYGV
jgi:hypothetical protein